MKTTNQTTPCSTRQRWEGRTPFQQDETMLREGQPSAAVGRGWGWREEEKREHRETEDTCNDMQ